MNLTTKYMGFELPNPLVPSASPLSREVDMVKRLEDAGAPAIVMFSLFEEEIYHEDEELEHHLTHGAESFPESLSYFPEPPQVIQGPEEYLTQVYALKEAVDIPVIASLNGHSLGGWIENARKIQEAGADGIELNLYHPPTEVTETGNEIEDLYVSIFKAVKEQVTIPVAMKLGSYFSALPAFARRVEDCGVDALVLFNRFYQPDINLEELEVIPNAHLSHSADIRAPLRWIAVLSSLLSVNLAGSTGVHSGRDVLKLIMVGADVAMACSSLLKLGPEHVRTILDEIEVWMEEHEYESIEQMKGSMNMQRVPDPDAFMRANYMKILAKYRYEPGER